MKGRDWRTGVWTEPDTMKAAYWEFEEDTAKWAAGGLFHTPLLTFPGRSPLQRT